MLLRPAILVSLVLPACASAPPAQPAPEQRVEAKEPPPPPVLAEPTRSDFQTLAKRLVGRCAGGAWISEWRMEHPSELRPTVLLAAFEDKTGKALDAEYLTSVLKDRMSLSRVYEMVEQEPAHFFAQGRLRLLSERSGSERIPIYTASLEIVDPQSQRVARRCEASVKGEIF